MKIGIRAHDMERAPLEQLVENISNKGFACAQLALKKAVIDFNTEEEAMTPGMAFYIKDIFAKNKVDIAVLGCYLNLTNPDITERSQIHEVYKTHIRFASLLGCGMVGTETGAVNREYSFEAANHSEAALEMFIENIKILVEYAEKMGVILGIEPVCRHIISDLERTYKVLRAVNSPNLQIIFDPVNLLTIHNYKYQDDMIKGAFELFGKEIGAIHAKDFYIKGEEIIEIQSGAGEFNSNLLIKLIKIHKPFIHVLLENTIPSNALTAKDYLINLYQSL